MNKLSSAMNEPIDGTYMILGSGRSGIWADQVYVHRLRGKHAPHECLWTIREIDITSLSHSIVDRMLSIAMSVDDVVIGLADTMFENKWPVSTIQLSYDMYRPYEG